MPASPDLGAQLASKVVELIADAELVMLRRVAAALAQGIAAPDWVNTKLLELRTLRARLERDLRGMDTTAARAITEVLTQAYLAGGAAAVADLDTAGLGTDVALPPARSAALEHLAAATVQTVVAVNPVLLSAVEHTFRTVIAEASSQVILGASTRAGAAQSALDRLLGQGIKGFHDSAGRAWDLTSYVSMAVRTSAGRAAIDGHLDHLGANGLDLVIVAAGPRDCPVCARWDGKVLSRTGGTATGAVSLPNPADGRSVRLTIAGTVEAARAAGWNHPNCRCSLAAYLPGLTPRERPAYDQAGYDAQQRQRAIERAIRTWKRRQVLALEQDGPAAKAAAVKVAAWQQVMREHLGANPVLKRQSTREQITRAH